MKVSKLGKLPLLCRQCSWKMRATVVAFFFEVGIVLVHLFSETTIMTMNWCSCLAFGRGAGTSIQKYLDEPLRKNSLSCRCLLQIAQFCAEARNSYTVPYMSLAIGGRYNAFLMVWYMQSWPGLPDKKDHWTLWKEDGYRMSGTSCGNASSKRETLMNTPPLCKLEPVLQILAASQSGVTVHVSGLCRYKRMGRWYFLLLVIFEACHYADFRNKRDDWVRTLFHDFNLYCFRHSGTWEAFLRYGKD